MRLKLASWSEMYRSNAAEEVSASAIVIVLLLVIFLCETVIEISDGYIREARADCV